jgi:peptidoglycan L-alanyl-D-glutamate endopeptidase CwlK
MTFDFSLIDPTFSALLQQLIGNMNVLGHEVKPYYGLRTLTSQAKLYRQSRSTADILAIINQLNDQDCNYIADILISVGQQPTKPWATNALPGESYHMWGLAADMFVDGDQMGGYVYDILASEALKLGLTPGRNFTHPDSGHIQLGATSLPYGLTRKQINDHFAGIK